MANKKCPDCGLEYDPKTFKQEMKGNQIFFICPEEHKNEIGKTTNAGWEYKYSYPFKPVKKEAGR